jgi:ATP-dependent RNA helicase DeaD
MLCKRGGVTRQDIGPIRIFERETKVLISDQAARDFARAVHGTEVQGVRIEPAAGPARAAKHARRVSSSAKKVGKAGRIKA